MAEGLNEQGIQTLEDLANTPLEKIEEAVKAAGVGRGAREKETWADQAKALIAKGEA